MYYRRVFPAIWKARISKTTIIELERKGISSDGHYLRTIVSTGFVLSNFGDDSGNHGRSLSHSRDSVRSGKPSKGTPEKSRVEVEENLPAKYSALSTEDDSTSDLIEEKRDYLNLFSTLTAPPEPNL